ncbi:glucose-6-phosphate dehydrogenase [Lacticaseibacillus yichunensis]|uniref:Glucose-6-phosphate 1-dehydrogenase n=1 Tax=Lacticaseibacillus yichunensis TaxID=2486015 RepID=A0ABW4CL90_9LACO|nr:glucose-6-phosphate dehydrogenase [Lacticaseibacillus yichunensis]
MTETHAVIILFGGSGDLARRKLYPALFGLYKRGILHDHFAVIGTARRPWSDEHYRDIICGALEDDSDYTLELARAFASHFYYQSHDVTDAAHYVTLKDLAQKLDDQYEAAGNRLFYMAMAPNFFSTIAEHIKSEALLAPNGFNRLVIEKPFGHDFASAKALNDSITATFHEEQIYRIDHYLGKEMTQALLALRFANPMFEAIWNKDYIQDMQITLAEAVGVETRAGYYETAGALRDMVQNHVMQLLGFLTMAKPAAMTPEAIHEVKREAFEQLHLYTEEEAAANFVRAQYGAATIAGTNIKAYRDEDGVAPDSLTETFVAGKILTDQPALAGVPIYVRTGKRLTRKSTQITVTFKPVGTGLFGDDAKASALTIYIEPTEGFTLQINGKTIGQAQSLMPEELHYQHDAQVTARAPEAYERLIENALEGDQTNFTNWHELAQTWRFVDVIESAWRKDSTMLTYTPGSMGPREASQLLAKTGSSWYWQPTRIQMAD